MPKFFFRALILMLFIAIGQPAMSSLASDLGDGTAPIPFDVFRVGMSADEVKEAGAKELEEDVFEVEDMDWDGYKCSCMLNITTDGEVKQAIFGFDLKTALLGMLTSELSSRDLYPVSSDVLMVKNPEKIFSKSKEELENIVAERFSALADAGEGDATFYYMPADVFEGAAKAGNDEDKISDLLLKSMLYVVEVGSVQNFSHIL